MSKRPSTVRTVKNLRRRVADWRQAGDKIALVPTMGALHEGHLSLVRLANRRADRTVVSIFVNPAQFAPHEDFDAYPRDEADDMAMLAEVGTDLVFAPSGREVYPDGFATSLSVEGPGTVALDDTYRPHFFGGVATVVAKLLIQCWPDYAMFGEKDYQQLLVVRRMAQDLDIPAKIIGGKTVREKDGLAMSSRNAYLTEDERARAPALLQSLQMVAGKIREGGDLKKALRAAKNKLKKAGFKVDYVEARNAETLAPLSDPSSEPVRLLAAAWLGKARLIDNIGV